MKICLYYFTGTGNTERVALCLEKQFGADCSLYKIEWPFAGIPDPNSFDMIGIGYPIHAFNTPKVVLDFFKKFPKANKKIPYFIFKNSGEPLHFNDSSSRKLIHRLKHKGYECIQEFHYIMPYNMVFRHSDGMAKKMWIYAQKMAEYNAKKVLDGVVEKPHFRPLQGWYIIPFRIEWPFTHTNGRHFKVDYAKCIHCGRCERSCPMKNVTIVDNKIKFGSRCVLCMNCSFSCPKKAITPGMFKHGWVINGSYNLEKLEKDDSIAIPVKASEPHFNKSYDQYFAECDRLLGLTSNTHERAGNEKK